MNIGWVKFHRRLVDHPRFKDPEWLAVWVYLLLCATHQPRKMDFDGRIVELKPGPTYHGAARYLHMQRAFTNPKCGASSPR